MFIAMLFLLSIIQFIINAIDYDYNTFTTEVKNVFLKRFWQKTKGISQA